MKAIGNESKYSAKKTSRHSNLVIHWMSDNNRNLFGVTGGNNPNKKSSHLTPWNGA